MIYLDILEGAYPEWHRHALCNGADPEIWFPTAPSHDFAEGARERATAEARRICGQCPVRRQCAEDAEQHRETWGVWAGVDREGGRKSDAA